MGDEVTHGIDRVYDGLEGFVDGLGRMLGVDTSVAASEPVQPAPAAPALPPSTTKALPPAGGTTASPRAFEILEVASVAGFASPAFIVTNGKASTLCKSREIAEQVIEAANKLLAELAKKAGTP